MKGQIMNQKFDELTRSLAQSVTRRQALGRVGIGLAGIALACFGLANRAEASGCMGECMNRCRDSGYPRRFCRPSCKAACG